MPNESQRPEHLTEQRVFEACQALASAGQRVTLDAVSAEVKRGSRTTIAAMVKKWRAAVAANDVAPNIPYPVLESLDAWFGDQRKGLEAEAAKAIEQAELQVETYRQHLESERARRTVAEQASEARRAHVRQQDRALAKALADLASVEAQLAGEKERAVERLAAHAAEISRMRTQIDTAQAAREEALRAKDAAVKAEGERVAAQMQSQIDRALVAQDEARRRADAAVAEAGKLRDALTAGQVELAKAQAEAARIQQVGQHLVDQAVARAEQAEKELATAMPGFVLDGPLVDHLTVRGNRLTERLVGMIERLDEPNEQVVQLYRLGAALTPLEAAAALHAAADETLRRRGSSLEQEVSRSGQNAEGATV